MTKIGGKKLKDVKKLEKSLDAVFSKYVRLKYSDSNGYCACVTCGKREHYKNMDAGHFITRDKKSVRFDERNVHPQCTYCNRYKHGEQYKHGLWIDKEYGEGTAKKLEFASYILTKRKPEDFEKLIAHYKQNLNKLSELI